MFLKYLIYVICIFILIGCRQHKSTSTTYISDNKSYSSIKKTYSEKLGISEANIKNEKLYRFIDEWYGVKYVFGGKDKNGIDCSALVFTLYANVFNKHISSTTKSLRDESLKIKESDLKEGDLVFFITDGSKISHIGVYLQNHKFLHASSKKGVMISDLNEPYFKHNFHSAGRIK